MSPIQKMCALASTADIHQGTAKPEVFKAWSCCVARWMSAVRSRHRLPPPGGAMRAYQTTGHLPVAVAQAFVLTRPPRGVGTSAQAISSLILTPRGCHCFHG